MIKKLKNIFQAKILSTLRLSNRIQRRDSTMDLWEELCIRSRDRSADYVENNMKEVIFYVDSKEEFQRKSLESINLKGLFLEFGVHRGKSLKLFSELTTNLFHGFDSFKGLPEDWTGHNLDKFFFKKPSIIKLPKNAILHKGWFHETIPKFLEEYSDNVAFIHIDCDIYSSTRDIFNLLGHRIIPGTVIVFDEYLNYPSWEQHEYKAFQEFIKSRNDISYKYTKLCSIGATYAPCSVCLEIIEA